MEYQKHHKYFAQVAGSLENVARMELTELGAEVYREVPRGLYFSATTPVFYKVLYQSRIIQRLLAPLLSFPTHSEKYLYDQAVKNIDWTALFKLTDSFGIESNVSDSQIKHSLYAGQILKDAICDRFRAKYNARPDFSAKEPDILFNLHIHRNEATISLDIGGGSLHKRGYRRSAGAAPLQETLAAAVVRFSGWDGETKLYDPMCGSGTLLAEALMSYCRIPAGKLRKHNAIRFMPDFDPETWTKIVKEADSQIRELPSGLISGSDISSDMVETASLNLSCLPGGRNVRITRSKFQDLVGLEGCTIITNPPYGVRLGSELQAPSLYRELGAWLRASCIGGTAYILCGSDELSTELRLRNRWKKTLKNGDLQSCLVRILIKERGAHHE